jgi:hypothetical protein
MFALYARVDMPYRLRQPKGAGMKRRELIVCMLLLSGCGGKVLKDDYMGPTAVLRDSYGNHVEGGIFTPESIDVFALSHVDGKFVENASIKTGYASVGSVYGTGLKPQHFERRVPVKDMRIAIMGVRHYTGPREASIRIRREMQFRPVAGEVYVVRGKLGRSGSDSSLWIETAGGQRVPQ